MQISVYGDTLCAQVTATALAQTGHLVHWFVMTSDDHSRLLQGEPLFREQGLDRLFAEQFTAGRLLPCMVQPRRRGVALFF